LFQPARREGTLQDSDESPLIPLCPLRARYFLVEATAWYRFGQEANMRIARKSAFITCLVLCVSLISGQLCAQNNRGPSTPEERAKAVKIAHKLENDPLSADAKDERAWIVRWLIEVPDIHVKLCTDVIGPKFASEKPYGGELVGQLMASQAAFVIENPSKSDDDVAVYTAGAEGVLKAYQSIQKQKPNVKRPSLDALLAQQASGTLRDAIRQNMKGCTK
jgi:hypothetical protein